MPINARLINSKCHLVLWITYCRNVRKRLRMCERLISLAYFEELSLSVLLSLLKLSLHFNILKDLLLFFFQTYLHVFNVKNNNPYVMQGRLDGWWYRHHWLCETATRGDSEAMGAVKQQNNAAGKYNKPDTGFCCIVKII